MPLPVARPEIPVTDPDATAPRWPGDRGGHVWAKDREVVADDGARVRYTVRGNEDGPWIVLASGFTCPDNFWMYLGPFLMERYRVIVMNYRGVGASTDPRPPGWRARNVRAGDYTIEKFAGDVGAVLTAEDARDVTVIGHSMGVQVALETWREFGRGRIAALVLVTGPYASPLHTFYGSKLTAYLFPFAEVGLPLMPRPVQRQLVRSLRLPIAMPLARLVQALGPHTPDEAMREFRVHFGNIDPMVTLKIARGMHDFDAGPWLADVDVPVQVVVGSRDRFSPPEIGQVMIESIPGSELVEVAEGTHGALIEFPEAIHDAIADFLHRRLGHPPVDRLGAEDRVSEPRTA